MNRLYVISAIAAGCLLSALPASAQEVEHDIEISLTVTNECLFEAPDNVDFGSIGVPDAVTSASTTLTVTCTGGTPYSIALSSANDFELVGVDTDNTLSYSLYRDEVDGTSWATPLEVADAAAGTQDYELYVVLDEGQDATVDVYSDTLTATLTYGALP